MKVISTNIGQPTTISDKKGEFKTGIYKTCVEQITLGKTDVLGDAVLDRKHHGGIDKACYMYSANRYNFWKEKFPDLYWAHGMFGENLTVENYNDSTVHIGDTYSIGSAIVQVSEPRRPCKVLGIRFGTQEMVKLFNENLFPGTYLRVLEEGTVKSGDEFSLIERTSDVSVADVFSLFGVDNKNKTLAKKVIEIELLAEATKNDLKTRFKL